MALFETHPKEVKILLQLIHSGELALPDFQRDFVWDPGAIEELIESIMRQYPAGSLLIIKDAGEKFQVREFENAPKLPSQSTPSQLVLDGQQRLTSLYQAFYGKGEHVFFINMNFLKDEIDIEGAVFYRTLKKAKKQGLFDKKVLAKQLILPLAYITDGKFDEWLDELMELRKEDVAEKKLLKDELRRVNRELLLPMLEYKFPVVTLQKETSMDAVCMMFETLNRRGVKLTVFELLMARSFADKVSLRQLWDETLIKHPIIQHFGIDPYYVLQAICLINQNSIKRADVLDLSPKLISQHWTLITDSLAYSLKLLQREEGVLSAKFLPYFTMLVPMTVVVSKTQNLKEIEIGKRNSKIRKWFWASIFASTYEVGPTARSVSDYKELLRWIEGEDLELYSLKKLYYTEDMLLEVTPKQRAHYSGVLALILSNGCKDFHNASSLSYDYMKENDVDDHHIFPKNFLKGKFPEEKINCIVNRTMIDASTNRTISDNPPSKYLKKISVELGDKQVVTALESHLIQKVHLEKDDFELFLKDRSKAILKLLSDKLGRVIPTQAQADEVSEDDEIDDDSSRRDSIDPSLVNNVPHDQLSDYPPLVKEIFDLLLNRTLKLNDKVWSKSNKRNVSFFSPEKQFFRARFQKSGLKLTLFTDGDELPHVTAVKQSDDAGQLYGHAKIRSFDELEKVFPSIELSYQKMLKAVGEGKNTSWFKGKRSDQVKN